MLNELNNVLCLQNSSVASNRNIKFKAKNINMKF